MSSEPPVWETLAQSRAEQGRWALGGHFASLRPWRPAVWDSPSGSDDILSSCPCKCRPTGLVLRTGTEVNVA